MEDNKLNKYLDEIGREELLSEAEEQQLSARVLKGDKRALDRLIEKNLKFVVAIARGYQGNGLDMDDLISEGNMGLMKAAAKFDATRGTRFVNFAVVYVRQNIEKALKRESDAQRVESRKDGQTRSIDAPLGSKTGVSLLSVLADGNAVLADKRVYDGNMATAFERAMASLEGREHQVISLYYGLEDEALTMAEIADAMQLRRERVRQIRDHALRRLKKNYRQSLAELRE
ncbi:MAG: sigma-70 family RNA polymerase sigma factor [Prevotella sp.]|nr:sigma-70 family RNA polymerase sigma factor [Prevotella sp.]